MGSHTQTILQRQLANRVLVLLSEYERQKEYSQFGSQVSSRTQKILHQGSLLKELLRQNPFDEVLSNVQIMLLSLAFIPFLLDKEEVFLDKYKKILIESLREDPNFNDTRKLAKEEISLDEFIKHIETKIEILEKICQ